tara:strand:- start:16553 stop:17380 length:828 start_codon:yes stop_codon:yes gene_type:complete
MKKNLFDLKGKIIVISGAAGLLGRKHADAVASYGGTPILLDLSQKEVDKFADKLNKTYKVNAMGFSVDITDEKAIKQNAKKIIKEYSKVDGLINNAAINPKLENDKKKNFSRLENFPLKTWNEELSVGLTGSFLCAKYYGLEISKNLNGGSIVNISSDLGLISPDQRLYAVKGQKKNSQAVKPISYSVVKTGLIGLTKYLATYWADKNVRCNAMCPGGVENDQPEDFLRKVKFRIPLGRMASSEEYQSTLVWMLSDASGYLNGAIVPIDGGRTSW